jgi:sporulation protein YlmC with PRC-barrel domain
MMKSTGIVRKAIYTKDGKIGVVKDLIIETGPGDGLLLPSSNLPKGFASPDWWVFALEVELDEGFKNELVAAKRLAPTKTAETFALKLSGFGRGAVALTEKGVEIKTTKAQAGDNIGTLDALFKPAKIGKLNPAL